MPSLDERVEFLINKVDNQRCADCFDKQPANIIILIGGLEKPMGAFICFRCARIHQKFGNDLGYVLNARNEDDWSEEEVQALERGGNKIVNAVFESKIAYDHPRPDLNSPNDVREAFCTEKYMERKFFSESKASKFMKTSQKQSSGRFALKAAAKDSARGFETSGSMRGLSTSGSSMKGFNSSDSSGDFSFDDASFGEEGAPEAGMNQLSLDQAEAKRPRQRVRARRRGSVGGDPGGGPRRAMSLQVEAGATNPNANVRRSRPGRRASLGRTSSMGGAPVNPGDEQQQQQNPRMRRAGRRGSIGTSNHSAHGSTDSLRDSGAAAERQRRAGKKGGALGNMLSLSNHGDKREGDMKSVASRESRLGKTPSIGGGGRRRPQRRGSIGVEDANAKLNEKKEMVW